MAARLHRRVLERPALRSLYDAQRREERKRRGDPPVTEAQVALLERLVLDEVRQREAREAPGSARRFAFAGVAVAAASLIAVLLVPRQIEEPARWRARGLGEGARVGVKLRCVSADQKRVLDEAEAGARARSDRLRCPHGALLAFSVTNLETEPRYVFAVGLGDDGGLRFFAPFHKDARAVLVEPGAVDRLLEPLADTAPLPKDERVSLFLLSGKERLHGHEVEARLSAAPLRQHLRKAARLPLPADVQARIEIVRDK